MTLRISLLTAQRYAFLSNWQIFLGKKCRRAFFFRFSPVNPCSFFAGRGGRCRRGNRLPHPEERAIRDANFQSSASFPRGAGHWGCQFSVFSQPRPGERAIWDAWRALWIFADDSASGIHSSLMITPSLRLPSTLMVSGCGKCTTRTCSVSSAAGMALRMSWR